MPTPDETPAETPEAHRRHLASAFDSLVASNLKLAASVENLVSMVEKQVKFSTVVVGLVVVLFGLSLLR